MSEGLFFGIDPGHKGAVAIISSSRTHLRVAPLPSLDGEVDVRGLRDLILTLADERPIAFGLIEKAQSMPEQGAVSGFTTGKNFGRLTACLELFGLPFEQVRPSVWKRQLFGAARRLATDASANKKALKEAAVLRARQLFPELASELPLSKDGLAEALLIAEVARRQYHGMRNADPRHEER